VKFSAKTESSSVLSAGNEDVKTDTVVDNPDSPDNQPVMPLPTNPTDSINEVVSYCKTMERNHQQANINFEDPGVTCDFGNNGNLEIRDGYFQGRIEQVQLLEEIPEGAIICDLSFEFSEQEMRYDDHFLLAFDGSLIASSYDFDSQLQSMEGLLQYDWSTISGMKWVTGSQYEGVFCPGQQEGLSACAWPKTDTMGTIALDYDPQLIQNIIGLNSQRAQHEFRFVTIGDNDSRDCEHSNINFQVNIEYVIPN